MLIVQYASYYEFFYSVCLRALYLGDNDLTSFPPCIDQFVQLEIVSEHSYLLYDHSRFSYLHEPTLEFYKVKLTIH